VELRRTSLPAVYRVQANPGSDPLVSPVSSQFSNSELRLLVGQGLLNHDGHEEHDGLIAGHPGSLRQAVVLFVSVVVITSYDSSEQPADGLGYEILSEDTDAPEDRQGERRFGLWAS